MQSTPSLQGTVNPLGAPTHGQPYGTILVDTGPDKQLRTIAWVLVGIGLLGGLMCNLLCILVPIGFIPEALYLRQSIAHKKAQGQSATGDMVSLVLMVMLILAPFAIIPALIASDNF